MKELMKNIKEEQFKQLDAYGIEFEIPVAQISVLKAMIISAHEKAYEDMLAGVMDRK